MNTVIIKTTGGDIYVTPTRPGSTEDHLERILEDIQDASSNDWMWFHVDRGMAIVRNSSITGVIARESGKGGPYA